MKDTKTQWLQWHPDFTEEELLVIRKEGEADSPDNEIGKIFRKYNIVEFIPPDQQLDVNAFYRTVAYACFYKADGATVNERPAEEITVSMVTRTQPEGLFRYFKENGITVENPYPGIYYILGEVLFSTQIIVISELDKEKHLWLRLLSNHVEEDELRRVLENVHRFKSQSDRESAKAVLEVCLRENGELAGKLMKDDSLKEILSEIVEPKTDI